MIKQGIIGALIVVICIHVFVQSGGAQPDWNVHPEDFEFSMTVTGKVTTDGYVSVDGNDLVAVFSDDVCRGKANLRYEPLMDSYFLYLMIYGNTPGESLSAKIYDASENAVVTAKEPLTFYINDVVGSLEYPYVFSSNLLNDEAELLSFSIPDQLGETRIENDTVYLQKPSNDSLAGIVASFLISTGAKIYANGKEQFSGESVNDFTGPVTYVVISADYSDTSAYIVNVTLTDNHPPEFISFPLSYVIQDDVYVYSVLVSDEEGDSIRISVENLPDWLTYNSISRVFFGTPGNEAVGDHYFKIRAGDGSMESVQHVVITVINVNDPPEIIFFIENQYFLSGRENATQLPKGCITDPDVNDQLTFRLTMENNSALPGWLSFDPETFILYGYPPPGTEGSIGLKLIATDQGKLSEWLVFMLEFRLSTSADDRQSGAQFQCYPNPVRNLLNVIVPDYSGCTRIRLINYEGKIVKCLNGVLTRRTGIAFQSISPGLYFVECQQGNDIKVIKVIKEGID
jgi:hypothetical protein